MKIALYYPWVHLTSGAERVLQELAQRSRHQILIFTNHYDQERTFPGLVHMGIREMRRISVERSLVATAGNSLRLMTQKLPVEGYDALVVVCEGLGDLVLLRNSQLPAACLCLTPLRAAFDPCYRERALSQRGPTGRLAVRAGTALFATVDRWLWRRYSAVIAISGEVRNRVVRAGLAPPESIRVAYPGIGVAPRHARAATRFGDYFLLPGRIMWTKNIELGLAAFQRFREMRPDLRHFRLVVAGIVDRKSTAYRQRLQSLAGPGVEFRIHPADAELADLYAEARAVVFTAFNEDSGIVPLESMAFGKPVLAVNRGGPRETVVHGETGFLEEPVAERFAVRMTELAVDSTLARRLGQAGSRHVRRFSWRAFTDCVDTAVEVMCQKHAAIRQPMQPEQACAVPWGDGSD